MLKSSSSTPRMRDVAFIALGSNLGDRDAYLSRARAALAALPESRLLAASEIEETAPIGPVDPPAFLNQMIALETDLAPHDLLERLLAIEASEGRTRATRWGPRTLDLDIVAFERQTVDDATLIAPHPELPNRDFWQRELAQLHDARSNS
jgi:2-amino-4-hydroxy-6-hydroxymethyldihydropteridine diphosphokinase